MSSRSALALAALLLAASAASAQTTFTELGPGIPPDLGSGNDYRVSSSEAADVDGDGDLDLLVLAVYVDFDTEQAFDRLTLYRNDGPGAVDTAWVYTAVAVPLPPGADAGTGDVAWGDYDGDGDPDAVVGFTGSTALYRNDGGALTLTPTELPEYDESQQFNFSTFDRRSITWADYDNDGDLDLLVPSVSQGFGDLGFTRLCRNDGAGAGDAWTFTVVSTPFPRSLDAQTTWGDMDGDGDLDLLIQSNQTFDDAGYVRLFRNTGGAFAAAGSLTVTDFVGTSEWMDYDEDGDLDVLLAGFIEDAVGLEFAVRIYRNTGGTYTPLTITSESTDPDWNDIYGATWADYDGDGDVDLLVSGERYDEDVDDLVGRSLIYANDGTGVFTRLSVQLPAPVFLLNGGAFTWYDHDGDGDLDYLVAGGYFVNGPDDGLLTFVVRLFRNDATTPNAAPTAPGALNASLTGNAVTLSWGPASDDHTATPGLTYNLWVRAAPGSDIVSPMARPGGTRLIPAAGNVSHDTHWTIRDLEPGTYTWTVQAIDNAFNGGVFATEGQFTVTTTDAAPGATAAAAGLTGVVPNPATTTAAVLFHLPEAADVAVRVYDALGREVLARPAQPTGAGDGRLLLDVEGLPVGVYRVRFETAHGGAVEVRTVPLTIVR